MNWGTLEGAIDCACFILTFGAFAYLAHVIDTTARRGRKG